MNIKNIDGLSAIDLQQQVDDGGRFVYFSYTVSFIILTFRRTSGVYFIRPGENAVAKSFLFTFLSFLLGWWGIPWGSKYTVAAIRSNLRGGKDVTNEVMAVVAGYALFEEASIRKK